MINTICDGGSDVDGLFNKLIVPVVVRKQILEYDDVSNDQRLTIYKLRNYFLEENDSETLLFEYLDNLLEKTADKLLPEDQNSNWKFDNLGLEEITEIVDLVNLQWVISGYIR